MTSYAHRFAHYATNNQWAAENGLWGGMLSKPCRQTEDALASNPFSQEVLASYAERAQTLLDIQTRLAIADRFNVDILAEDRAVVAPFIAHCEALGLECTLWQCHHECPTHRTSKVTLRRRNETERAQ